MELGGGRDEGAPGDWAIRHGKGEFSLPACSTGILVLMLPMAGRFHIEFWQTMPLCHIQLRSIAKLTRCSEFTYSANLSHTAHNLNITFHPLKPGVFIIV
jgi:hypothetical protein